MFENKAVFCCLWLQSKLHMKCWLQETKGKSYSTVTPDGVTVKPLSHVRLLYLHISDDRTLTVDTKSVLNGAGQYVHFLLCLGKSGFHESRHLQASREQPLSVFIDGAAVWGTCREKHLFAELPTHFNSDSHKWYSCCCLDSGCHIMILFIIITHLSLCCVLICQGM